MTHTLKSEKAIFRTKIIKIFINLQMEEDKANQGESQGLTRDFWGFWMGLIIPKAIIIIICLTQDLQLTLGGENWLFG